MSTIDEAVTSAYDESFEEVPVSTSHEEEAATSGNDKHITAATQNERAELFTADVPSEQENLPKSPETKSDNKTELKKNRKSLSKTLPAPVTAASKQKSASSIKSKTQPLQNPNLSKNQQLTEKNLSQITSTLKTHSSEEKLPPITGYASPHSTIQNASRV